MYEPVQQPVYSFEGFRLDVQRRVLFGLDGKPILLTPRLFDALVYFVERPGQLLTKKQLLEAIWPCVVVEEHNLNKTISELRRVLGEKPAEHKFFVTKPGHGYRFVAKVLTASVPASPSPAADDAPPKKQQEKSDGGELGLEAGRGPIGRWWSPNLLFPFGAMSSALLLVAFGWWLSSLSGPAMNLEPIHVVLDVRPAERLPGSSATSRPSRTAVRISPDGRTFVFAAIRNGVLQLFERRLSDREAIPMPGTDGAREHFFSPDGQWVGFWSDGHFKRAQLNGGPPIEIGAVVGGDVTGPQGASWALTDEILFATPHTDGILSISIANGEVRNVVSPAAEDGRYVLPFALPDGRALLFTAVGGGGNRNRRELWVYRRDTGEKRRLLADAADGRYLRSGLLMFMRRGTLMAVAFDSKRYELRGSPVPILEGVMQAIHQPNTRDETLAGQYDAVNGTLIFLGGGIHPPYQNDMVWVDRTGTPKGSLVGPGSYHAPRLSADGKHVAYVSWNERGDDTDIWVYDIEQRTSRRITFDGGEWPLWSPDGRTLLYLRNDRVLSIAVEDSEKAGPVQIASVAAVPASWVGDDVLAVVTMGARYPELWRLTMANDRTVAPYLQAADYALRNPALSPDGQWLAYVSWEAGGGDVYIRRFAEPSQVLRVSTRPQGYSSGGESPHWTRGGRELIYIMYPPGRSMQVLAAEADASGHLAPPRLLFEGPYGSAYPANDYDVTPDGELFIMTRHTGGEPPVSALNLVLNWDRELKAILRNPSVQ